MPVSRLVFWDGLLSSVTSSTVEACATFLENKELPEDKITEFLGSLSFVKHPTDDTLAAVSVSLIFHRHRVSQKA